MTPTVDTVPAPGARVLIRDAEWVVRRADLAPDGGYRLVCDGVSELVREREAVFLTTLEPDLRVLDPAETRLVPDPSPGFADSRLWMESQLREAVPSDERIHVGHGAAMDLVPYQLDPARQALRQPRQRILIADAVGLGKTLEAGILVSELIARGRGRRILVLAVKSMLTQFQKEFWNRFTIPLTRLDSIGIQRVRSRIPTSHNPFYYYDKAIISIDTLKQDAEYRTYLEQAYRDVIVIDEAHNVADRGTGSLRSRLARLLARRSDTLVMLSATPHDGRARSFASLMNMLDATAIADPDDFSPEDFRDKGLVIRRFKKDVQAQVRETFRDREIIRRRFSASPEEAAAFKALLAVKVVGDGGGGRKWGFSHAYGVRPPQPDGAGTGTKRRLRTWERGRPARNTPEAWAFSAWEHGRPARMDNQSGLRPVAGGMPALPEGSVAVPLASPIRRRGPRTPLLRSSACSTRPSGASVRLDDRRLHGVPGVADVVQMRLRANHPGHPYRIEQLPDRIARDRLHVDDLVRGRRRHVDARAEVRDEKKLRDLRPFEIERYHEPRQADLPAVECAHHRRRTDRVPIGVHQHLGLRAVVGEVPYVVRHQGVELGEGIPVLGHEILPFDLAHLVLRRHRRAGHGQTESDGRHQLRRQRRRGAERAFCKYERLHPGQALLQILIERPSASDSR